MGPPKKQATLFQFSGFKKVSSHGGSHNPIQDPCHCQFCGDSFHHTGAKFMHEAWCKERPKKPIKPDEIVSYILNDILKEVIKDEPDVKLADIFSKSSSMNLATAKVLKPNNVKETSKEEESSKSTENEPPIKKSRKSYDYIQKAETIDKYFAEKERDRNISYSAFAEQAGVSKSMLIRWVQEKNAIYQKASEEKVCHFKKGRVSNRHEKTHPLLYKEFMKMRQTGRKISFLWMWITGRKMAKSIEAPPYTKKAVQQFLKKYDIKVRRIQRKKQVDKNCFVEKIREWHLKFREGVVKSKNKEPTYDPKWGRFKPHQRFNVDQVPLPFVLDKTTTYEMPLGRNEKVWIASAGSGLEKRQCTLQVCFSPENNHVKVEIIFRGKGKGIKENLFFVKNFAGSSLPLFLLN